MISISTIVALKSKRGYRGREGGARDDDAVMRIAVHLADRLADWKSLAFFRLVARSVPAQVIQGALTCALDVPAADLRVSRAACFTALVRPYLPKRKPRPA